MVHAGDVGLILDRGTTKKEEEKQSDSSVKHSSGHFARNDYF